jgi:4-hydroxythreonine-4-phosphate dehydrogenase
LIPFKYINAGRGVNYSAGLPIIRTSPDHGVAYDIAGKGIADESSMIEAVRYAEIILKNRRKKTNNQ